MHILYICINAVKEIYILGKLNVFKKILYFLKQFQVHSKIGKKVQRFPIHSAHDSHRSPPLSPPTSTRNGPLVATRESTLTQNHHPRLEFPSGLALVAVHSVGLTHR
ncbi:hypothetical protein H1C71_014895 [Ictidomys tridecemlineatus]|nr:hypothetical protein H1C71_014895 [Ictidomys tridecemlineatus]